MGSKFKFRDVNFHVAGGREPVENGEFVIDLQGLAIPQAGYGISIPTKDFGLPTLDASGWDTVLGIVKRQSNYGNTIRISCTAGLGRSGTVLAILLAGLSPDSDEDPVAMARERRPHAIETDEQEDYARSMGEALRVLGRARLKAESAERERLLALIRQAEADEMARINEFDRLQQKVAGYRVRLFAVAAGALLLGAIVGIVVVSFFG